jgi:MAF protein
MCTARTVTDRPPSSPKEARLNLADTPVSLASASPRRAELMAITGWAFETSAADIDESPMPNESPEALVLRLARTKASRATESSAGALVVAADTEVILDEAILGKPADRDRAAQMLADLRGREHRVITGIAVLDRRTGKLLTDICETKVKMRRYDEADLREYVASDAPLDKAGGYGIQDRDFNPVDMQAMKGCVANVMGLPLCHLTRLLRKFERESVVDTPGACRQHTRYLCEIFPSILQETE